MNRDDDEGFKQFVMMSMFLNSRYRQAGEDEYLLPFLIMALLGNPVFAIPLMCVIGVVCVGTEYATTALNDNLLVPLTGMKLEPIPFVILGCLLIGATIQCWQWCKERPTKPATRQPAAAEDPTFQWIDPRTGGGGTTDDRMLWEFYQRGQMLPNTKVSRDGKSWTTLEALFGPRKSAAP